MQNDPATLEIMRNYFSAICTNMGSVIERTSYTTYVKESADYAAALATPQGEFFAYPRTVGVTIFLGLNLKKAIEACGELHEGDIVITNDPYSTNGLATHLTDVHIFKPIFDKGLLVCYAWAFVHCSDIGGLVPSSISPKATDVHQEGLRIPPIKLYKDGKLNEDIRSIFLANSRIPTSNYGDINAMVSALNTAENKIHEMIRKFGTPEVTFAMDGLMEQSARRAGQIIQNIPDGSYHFADYLDDDLETDIPIRLAVDATIEGETITLDFSDCDPQVGTAFNLVTNGTRHSFLFQGLINYIISSDPDIPINGAITHPIKVIAPKGTLVNAQYPAAVGLRHAIVMRLYNVVLGALAPALPSDIPAAGGGQAAIVVLSTPGESDGEVKVSVIEPMGGGGGGQYDMDGVDGIDHASGFLRNTPVESLELHSDTIVRKYELVPDTAGPGYHRGGHAIRLDFEIMKPGSIVTARGLERLRFQPWGLSGGKAGTNGMILLNPDTKEEEQIPKINILKPQVGDVISMRSASGGGWGDPFKREPARVLTEIENGLLSPAQAKVQYGVAVDVLTDGNIALNEALTEQLRSSQPIEYNPTVYDFGKAREQYESIWTPGASDFLARKCQTISISQRSYRKHLVHFCADEQFPQKKLSVENIIQIWEHIEDKHNIIHSNGL